MEAELVHYPNRSAIYLRTVAGSETDHIVEDYVKQHQLDVGRFSELRASAEELVTEPLFSCFGCSWTDDMHKIVAKPAYSGRDACSNCGKGGTELTAPLEVYTRKLNRAHFVRIPPGLFLASSKLVETATEKRWAGLTFAPVLERGTREVSDKYQQLIITSILPPMHASTPIVPNGWPEPCRICRRLGFKIDAWQPIYDRSVLQTVADWNVSEEWLAPHAVSCPQVICPRVVVHVLCDLEPYQSWIPVKLVD